MASTYHVAFGVYGIITDADELVVIKKTGGPYRNRYDLPGGSLEDGESLDHALMREIHEETGLTVVASHQLGATSFKYPWAYQQWQLNQHICVFSLIDAWAGQLQAHVAQFQGQDALGAVRMPLAALSQKNASPLVLKAKAYLNNRQHFAVADTTYATWQVLADAVYGK